MPSRDKGGFGSKPKRNGASVEFKADTFADWVTGAHKRKLERQKRGHKEAEDRAKDLKRAERREARQQIEQVVQEHFGDITIQSDGTVITSKHSGLQAQSSDEEEETEHVVNPQDDMTVIKKPSGKIIRQEKHNSIIKQQNESFTKAQYSFNNDISFDELTKQSKTNKAKNQLVQNIQAEQSTKQDNDNYQPSVMSFEDNNTCVTVETVALHSNNATIRSNRGSKLVRNAAQNIHITANSSSDDDDDDDDDDDENDDEVIQDDDDSEYDDDDDDEYSIIEEEIVDYNPDTAALSAKKKLEAIQKQRKADQEQLLKVQQATEERKRQEKLAKKQDQEEDIKQPTKKAKKQQTAAIEKDMSRDVALATQIAQSVGGHDVDLMGARQISMAAASAWFMLPKPQHWEDQKERIKALNAQGLHAKSSMALPGQGKPLVTDGQSTDPIEVRKRQKLSIEALANDVSYGWEEGEGSSIKDIGEIDGIPAASAFGRYRKKPLSKRKKDQSSRARKERKNLKRREKEEDMLRTAFETGFADTNTKGTKLDIDERPLKRKERLKNESRVKKHQRTDRMVQGKYYFGDKSGSVTF